MPTASVIHSCHGMQDSLVAQVCLLLVLNGQWLPLPGVQGLTLRGTCCHRQSMQLQLLPRLTQCYFTFNAAWDIELVQQSLTASLGQHVQSDHRFTGTSGISLTFHLQVKHVVTKNELHCIWQVAYEAYHAVYQKEPSIAIVASLPPMPQDACTSCVWFETLSVSQLVKAITNSALLVSIMLKW